MTDLQRSHKLYGGSDLSPVNDYTIEDWTDWDQTELANAADGGQSTTSTWQVRDEAGVIPDRRGGYQLGAHNVVITTIGSNTLFRGRVEYQDRKRGRQQAQTGAGLNKGRAGEWSVNLSDANSHLDGIIMHDDSYPEQTDAARVQAIVARWLSGTPRATTNLNGSNLVITGSNLITVPAKTYSGTTPSEALSEIAEMADKELFVTVDNELAYFGHDYTGYSSVLRISDDPADLNANTCVPIDPARTENGRDTLTALRTYWGGTTEDDFHTFQRIDDTRASINDFWEDVNNDSDSTTWAEASLRATNILASRKLDQTTYTVTIGAPGSKDGGPMTGDDIYKVKAGQLIEFKALAARGGVETNGTYIGDSFLTRRIREVRWTFVGVDAYYCTLTLDRPRRNIQGGLGGPNPAPDCTADPGETEIVDNTDVLWPGTYPVVRCGISNMHNVGASGGKTSRVACTAGNGYVLHLTICGTGHEYNVTFKFYDDPTAGTLISTDGPTSLGTISTGTVVDRDVPFTAPALAESFTISLAGKLGGWNYQGTVGETPAVGGGGGDDPFCLPAGTGGDSPYWARSDDPRFTNDDQHIVTRLSQRVINNSAITLEQGDVVIPDITYDGEGVTTTTSAALTAARVGVVHEGGDVGADIVVVWEGVLGFVNDGAATSADGNYLTTSTTAGAAAVSATRITGSVGRVIRDDAGDPAYVLWWGVPDTAGGGGGSGDVATDTIWDAKGDLAVGTGANTAARLAVGANDTIPMADSGETTGIKWVASGTPSTQAFGDAAAVGTADTFTRGDHKHAMPATPSLDTLSNVVETSPANGDALAYDGTDWDNRPQYVNIPVVLGGAGTVLVTGEVLGLKVTVPFKCTILRWDLFADVSGSVVVDIWKDTYANFPPANGDSITASAKPTLSSVRNNQSSTLTGWTTTINADDVLAFEIESVTTVTQVTLNLICKRIY